MPTVFVLGEDFSDPLEVPVDGDLTASKIAGAVGTHKRQDHSSYLVFIEDGDDPLEAEAIIDGVPPCFHVHRCHRVAVAVEYNGKTAAGEFSPASTVAKVLGWAVKDPVFNFHPNDRPRFALALQGGDGAPLPERDHVGQFASHDRCGVSFVLVERSKPQG